MAAEPLTESPPFSDLWQECYEFHQQAGLQEAYLEQMNAAHACLKRFGFPFDMPIDQVDRKLIARWDIFMDSPAARSKPKIGEKRGLAPASQRAYLAMVQSFFTWCIDEHWIAKNPMEHMPKPKGKSTRTRDRASHEIQAVLDEVEQRTNDPRRNRAIIAFAVGSGARISEIVAQTWEDLRITQRVGADGQLVFRDDGKPELEGSAIINQGKGDKERTVYFSDMESGALLSWWVEVMDHHHGETPTGRIFPITQEAARRMLALASKNVGIAPIKPHQLRATFSTNLLRANPGAVGFLQAQLGHSKVDQSLYYAHLDEQRRSVPIGSTSVMGLH